MSPLAIGERDEALDSNGERPAKRLRITSPLQTDFGEVGLMRSGSSQVPASFVGSASGIHFVQSVYSTVSRNDATATQKTTDTPGSDLVPGEEDRLASISGNNPSKYLWHANEVESELNPGSSFTFDELVEWTSSYFDVWHPAFPFLHAPSVLESFEKLSRDGIIEGNLAELPIIKTLICMSIADRRQISSRMTRAVPRSLVFSSFDEILDSVQPAITKPATIEALQSVVCAQLFLISMLGLNAASRLGGLIIRMAFQLGLHRCPARFQSFSIHEQELRRRLFWSIYCIDRHVCHALGLPLTIRDDDVDVCYPGKEAHGANSLKGSPHSLSVESDNRLRLLTLLAQHAEIKGLIMELRNKRVAQREESLDRAIHINTRITQWWNKVEDSIEQAEIQKQPLQNVHIIILKILKHESRIALNRPLLALPKQTTSYTAALHTCVAAAKSVISLLHTSLATESPQTMRVKHGHPLQVSPMFWPSLTWSVWMSAFIIVYASMENEVDQNVVIRSTDKTLQVLEQLAARGSVWSTACAAAIRDLRQRLTLSANISDSTPTRSSAEKTTESTREPLRQKQPEHVSTEFSTVQHQYRRNPGSEPTPELRDVLMSSIGSSGPKPHSQAALQTSSTMLPGNNSRSHTSVNESNAFLSNTNSLSLQESNSASIQALEYDSFSEQMIGNLWPNLESVGLENAMAPILPENLDPLQEFDIPFWMDQDNAAWMSD